MELAAKSPVKQVQIEAVIIRADGSTEDLGVVSDSKWKWYKFWTYRAKNAAKDRINEANAKAGF